MAAFMLLNGGAALAAILLSMGSGGARAGDFLLKVLAAYLILIHSIALWSGLVGRLTVEGAAIALALTLVGAGWRAWRSRGAPREEPSAPPRFTALEAYPVLAAIVAGAIWAWPHLWAATRLWIWDDYTYHMVYPALWLRGHSIAAVDPAQAFTMQAWYPLGASLVAAWLMLPFHGVRGDALAWVSLTGPLYVGAIACSAAVLLARVGCRRRAWAMPVVLLVTSPRIDVMASTFSDADLAMAATLVAAMAFAIPRGNRNDARPLREDAWYAALLSGIAIGIKVSAAVPAFIVFGMVLLRAAGARATARVALIFAASWAATGGYWYARNWVQAGNPLYPAAFLIWPGSTFPETTLREYAHQYGLAKTLVDALVVYANWPVLHAGIAACGLCGLAGWLLWRRGRASRPQAYFAVGTLVLTAAMLALLPGMPYSAGNAMTFRSGFVHWDSMRYVAPLPVLGWIALGFLLDAGAGATRWRDMAAASITTAALSTSTDRVLRSPAVLIGLALCAVAASLVAHLHHPRSGSAGRYALAAAALSLAALVLWHHDAKSAATAASIYGEPLFGGAAATLDRQPPGTRVALFGDQWVFPAFGARDHLEPVRLDGNGRVATGPIGDAMEPGPLTVDPSVFVGNLEGAGVCLVTVVHLPHPGRSPERPAQEAALSAAGAHLEHRSNAVTVWRLETAACSPSAAPGDRKNP
jgi:hypothetical protein